MADLADAEVKDGFLDAINRRVKAVIDGVHEAEQARGEAWITANDFRNLSGEPMVGVEEFAQGGFDAAEGGETWAFLNFGDNGGAVAWGDLRQNGTNVHVIINIGRVEITFKFFPLLPMQRNMGGMTPGETISMDADLWDLYPIVWSRV